MGGEESPSKESRHLCGDGTPTAGFSTTAPIDIASQFSPSNGAWAEHSLSVFAKQKTGQSRVSAKQMLAAARIISSL